MKTVKTDTELESIYGKTFLYNAYAELFLSKDTGEFEKLLTLLANTPYIGFASDIALSIGSLKNEIAALDDGVLLERSYKNIDIWQVEESYGTLGYILEQEAECDHLGAQLKLLSLLCLEEAESDAQAVCKQLRFINARLTWLDSLQNTMKDKGLHSVASATSFLGYILNEHIQVAA